MKKILRVGLNFIAKLIGISVYDWYLFKGLKRYEWIYRSEVKIPHKKLTFTLIVRKNIADDIALCERLISSFNKSMKDFSAFHDLSEMWKQIIESKFSGLISDLSKSDPNTLAMRLQRMFQSDYIYGIASGDLYKGLYRRRLGLRIWSLKILSDIVSLAEYLAVVRTECPEQRGIGYALSGGGWKN